LLRGDSLFTYTGGVESYRGKVSGGGGSDTTSLEMLMAFNRNALGGEISLGTNSGGIRGEYSDVISIGHRAGQNNIGTSGTFLGTTAGTFNNSEFSLGLGYGAAAGNTGDYLIAIGYDAGDGNVGDNNILIGTSAGNNNTSNGSIFIGAYTDHTLDSTFENAVAIGNRAFVNKSNSIILGSIAGVNGASASTSVGIGTTTPTAALHVVGAPRFATDSAAAGYVWTAKDNTGQGEWRVASGGGSGITTAQLTDSLNAREPRYKFRNDSTGNAGYTTLFQRNKLKDSLQANIDLKANTASPNFTGTVTTPMLWVTGRTSLQGLTINKDSLPISTTNRWAVTIDTPTNRLQRFDLERKADTFNQVFTGSISLSSTTGGIGLPPMTQAQMDAIVPSTFGVQVYNTTYEALKVWVAGE
jgi:hypothetical protein